MTRSLWKEIPELDGKKRPKAEVQCVDFSWTPCFHCGCCLQLSLVTPRSFCFSLFGPQSAHLLLWLGSRTNCCIKKAFHQSSWGGPPPGGSCHLWFQRCPRVYGSISLRLGVFLGQLKFSFLSSSKSVAISIYCRTSTAWRPTETCSPSLFLLVRLHLFLFHYHHLNTVVEEVAINGCSIHHHP